MLSRISFGKCCCCIYLRPDTGILWSHLYQPGVDTDIRRVSERDYLPRYGLTLVKGTRENEELGHNISEPLLLPGCRNCRDRAVWQEVASGRKMQPTWGDTFGRRKGHKCLTFLTSFPLNLVASSVCQWLPCYKPEGRAAPRVEKGRGGCEGQSKDTQHNIPD